MRRAIRMACGLGLWWAAAAAHAVVLGATDTFEDGSVNGWTAGPNNPSPPANVATGGPAGTDDNYLRSLSTGGAGPGSRLVVIAGPQWTGDYVAAGVSGLSMDLNNMGAADLSLRLVLSSGTSSAISNNAVLVPAGSGWVRAAFSLDPAMLTPSPAASVADILAAVGGLRLFHGTQPVFPGEAVAAQLGMDNVAAVPEPATAVMLACGLLALAARRRQPQLPAPSG